MAAADTRLCLIPDELCSVVDWASDSPCTDGAKRIQTKQRWEGTFARTSPTRAHLTSPCVAKVYKSDRKTFQNKDVYEVGVPLADLRL